MAYTKPQTKKATPKKEETTEQSHMCDVCDSQAVVRHSDGFYYCQPHYSLRLESVSREKIKTKSDSILDNYAKRA